MRTRQSHHHNQKLATAFARSFCLAILGLPVAGCTAVARETPAAEIAATVVSDAAPEDAILARQRVLHSLADRLEMAYLFPDEGAKYAQHLRSREITVEEAGQAPEDFAKIITAELQAIHPDAHLRLEAAQSGPGGPGGPGGEPPAANMVTHHFAGTAYLRLDAMWGADHIMTALDDFVTASAEAKTLIIDLRKNRGGGLREMDLLFSHLFSEPTDLVVMELRKVIYESDGMPFGEAASMRRIEAPEKLVRMMHSAAPAQAPLLTDLDVLVLTSPTTASAAEHLALSLQRTGRAMVIGEPSRGAAHFGGLLPTGNGFRAFIPAGRTYDPDTGASWEGKGIAPDLASSAEDALDIALERAGHDQAERRSFVEAVG